MRLRGAVPFALTFAGAFGAISVACGTDDLGVKVPEIDASVPEGGTSSSGGGSSSGGSSSGGSSSGGSSSGGSSSGAVNGHTVGGTVTGLPGGKFVVLTLGPNNDVTVTMNTGFTFAFELAQGASYAVTVKTQPNLQKCVVTNGTGTMGATNVTNVTVDCSATTCGDGIVDTASGETCDDGNANDVDACANACTKNPLFVGGNEKAYIENALALLNETTSTVPGVQPSYGNAPGNGIFITSSEGGDATFPLGGWQTFLDAGGQLLVVGGNATDEYRAFIGNFLGVSGTGAFHTVDCASDWNKVGTHAVTTLMPATYDFANQSSSFHMLHFTATQPTGAVILGSTCEAGDNGILAMRTYASGGTFTYLAFDVGKYTGAGTPDEFLKPFLQGYLAYVRSKK